MRHLKNEVDTVKKDVECGLKFADMEEKVENGDVIICYQLVKQAVETEWDPGF